jgi:hypothetical protein
MDVIVLLVMVSVTYNSFVVRTGTYLLSRKSQYWVKHAAAIYLLLIQTWMIVADSMQWLCDGAQSPIVSALIEYC